MSWCEKCRQCYYSGSISGALSETMGYCNYMECEGHARSTICEAGENCTVWKPKDGRQSLDVDRAKELYDQGCVDARIAEELKVDAKVIRKWRQANGLPSQKKKKESTFDAELARKLFDDGMTDEAAAACMGIAPYVYKKWRQANGLKHVNHTQKARMEAYKEGLTDAEAAEELGISISAFRSWRHRNGLLSNELKKDGEEKARRSAEIIRRYKSGMPVMRIAEEMGLTRWIVQNTIYRERQEGL